MTAAVARHQIRSQQLTVLHGTYAGLTRLEEKLFDARLDGKGTPDYARAWRDLFLNNLEYYAFLVNHRFIRDPGLEAYLSTAFLPWYERIFLPEASSDELQDGGIYGEMKSLYYRLTDPAKA